MKKVLLSVSAMLSVLAVDAQQRVPLFEVFTSSTCGPCKPGNAVYEGVVAGKPAGEFVGIKYQQDFPGSGDPYCTNETVNRRSYYSINSIPRMEIDGGWDKNAQSFTNSLYTSAKAAPAKFALSGTYSIKNKVVTMHLKYSPLATTSGATLYVAIVERETVQNKKSNGETIFYDVVKKMVPNQVGSPLPTMSIGAKDSMTLTFTFNGNYRLPADGKVANRIKEATEHSVEDFSNLKVVAWVQGSDKAVYQAANLMKVSPADIEGISNTMSEVSVYPNPASSVLSVDLSMKQSDQVTARLVSVTGAVVATQSIACAPGQNKISIETAQLASGYYTIIVTDSRNNSFSQKVTIVH